MTVEELYRAADNLREQAVGDPFATSSTVLALTSLAFEVRALGVIIRDELREAAWPLKKLG